MRIENDTAPYSSIDTHYANFIPAIPAAVKYIDKYIQPIIVSAIGLFGIVTNVLSICVFIKQGIKDCVSVCLLSLSVTDLGSVMASFLGECIKVNPNFEFDPIAIHYVMIRTSGMFYHCSTLTTALLALERCLCVSWPIKFKDFFTFNRAVLAVGFIYAIVLCTALPDFATYRLNRRYDFRTNSTRTVLMFTPHRKIVERFITICATYTLEPACLIVVMVSACVMTADLRQSSQLQKNHNQINKNSSSGSNNLLTKNSWSSNKTSSANMRSNPSSRNRRVEKIILILAILCFVCNSLRLIAMSVVFEYLGVENVKYETWVLLLFVFFLQTSNASVNFFVYYVLNVTFRRTVELVFCNRGEN